MADQTEFDRTEALEAVKAVEAQEAHEQRTLDAVVKALTEEKNLLLAYIDAKGRATHRVVEPRGVKRSKAGDLSMVVMDLGKKEWRQFRSDRIQAIREVAL